MQLHGTATLPVHKGDFPLAFLTVEEEQIAYNGKAADLPSITPAATVVVNRMACGKRKQAGNVALVFKNPSSPNASALCAGSGMGRSEALI